MNAARRAATPDQRFGWFAVAVAFVATVAIDQASKAWVWHALRGAPGRTLIADRLSIEFAFNSGGLFGLGASHRYAWVVLATASVIAVVVVMRVGSRPHLPKTTRIVCGCAAGGIAGNLVDRLIRDHPLRIDWLRHATFDDFVAHPVAIARALADDHRFFDVPRRGVIDFLVVHLGPGRSWPAFNFADMAIVVALPLLLLSLAAARERARAHYRNGAG